MPLKRNNGSMNVDFRLRESFYYPTHTLTFDMQYVDNSVNMIPYSSPYICIRAFLIPQIHFFFVLLLEVFSKKIIKNIPYGERVQLVRLVLAPETSFFPFK